METILGLGLFTSLFGMIVGLLTNARRAEVFASTDAYTVVLVVRLVQILGRWLRGWLV